MNEAIALGFQLFMLITAIAVVFQKNNFTVIILMSVYSLIAATLYMLNQAPDVAIAEVAINAAIIPLIYVIAISRQRELIVFDTLHHGEIGPNTRLQGEIYEYLYAFSKKHKLRLNLCCDLEGSQKTLIEEMNVDLIITQEEGVYVLKGKQHHMLMKKMVNDLKHHPHIRTELIEEGHHLD
jgi:uncharacterized MnhB-related membrane protein